MSKRNSSSIFNFDDMVRTFLNKILILALLIMIPISLIYIFPFYAPSDSAGYNAVHKKKHDILENTPSPKIIFIGGSNLAFGLDSTEIEKSTGYPTINMGLQAGLGLNFMMDDIAPTLNRGDIVIVSPEYEQFGELYSGGQHLGELYATNPKIISAFPSLKRIAKLGGQTYPIFKLELKEIQRRLKNMPISCHDITGVYCLNSFNEHGDMVAHRKVATRGNSDTIITFNETPSAISVSGVVQFVKHAQENGASILFSFPPFEEKHYKANKDILNSYANEIKQIPGLVVLDSPNEYQYPSDFFFDSKYHLNATGTTMRTKQIGKKIIEYLETGESL